MCVISHNTIISVGKIYHTDAILSRERSHAIDNCKVWEQEGRTRELEMGLWWRDQNEWFAAEFPSSLIEIKLFQSDVYGRLRLNLYREYKCTL